MSTTDPKKDKDRQEFFDKAGAWLDDWFGEKFKDISGMTPDEFKKKKAEKGSSWFDEFIKG